MGAALQLPFHRSPAEQVGDRTFLKRLLPVCEIRHPRRHLRLDLATLRGLAREFAARRRGQVPLLHGRGLDPERWRGEVKRLEVRDDGLYGLLEMSERGARLLAETPDLPLSARLSEGGGRRLALAHLFAAPGSPAGAGAPLDFAAGTTTIDLSAGSFAGDPEDEADRILAGLFPEHYERRELAEAAAAQFDTGPGASQARLELSRRRDEPDAATAEARRLAESAARRFA